jgi:hypothetical protein
MVYLVTSLHIQSILLTLEIPKFAVVPVMAASSDLLVEQFRHFPCRHCAAPFISMEAIKG